MERDGIVRVVAVKAARVASIAAKWARQAERVKLWLEELDCERAAHGEREFYLVEDARQERGDSDLGKHPFRRVILFASRCAFRLELRGFLLLCPLLPDAV